VAVKFGKDGYFEITYDDFSGGLDVQQPEITVADNATPSANNFQTRNKELRSRPAFLQQYAGMDNVNPGLGTFSFLDANGVQHTVGWNTRGLWQLAPAGLPVGSSPWAILGGPAMEPGIPVAYQVFANILYYVNGGPFLATWDGIGLTPTASQAFSDGSTASSVAGVSQTDAPTVITGTTGPLAIGGLFIGELNDQILLANVSVLDQLGVNNATNGTLLTFPQRLWWSANGIPAVWDPSQNTSAGFNDFLDVPDIITGLATIGVCGFLFRSNGITFFTPTGNSAAPFQFDHEWASNHGIGNVFPWSISSYGSIVCFISVEQIYQMGVSDFTPIGGTARDAIMADLGMASGNPVASIVPTEQTGYVYMRYVISIPLTTFTRHYWLDLDGKGWTQHDTPNLAVTGRPEEVWTGILSSLPVGAVPASTGATGSSGAPSSGGGGVPAGSGGAGGGGGGHYY
jgi:hypothetical protein